MNTWQMIQTQAGQNLPQNQQPTQKTEQQLREEIRENVRQQLEAAARATRVRPVTPVTPLPPNIDIPGVAVTMPAMRYHNEIPPQAVDITIAFFLTVAVIIIGLPLARAFARRMDRRGSAQTSPDVASHLNHLSQAVDAIAVEVERISEGQRFTTKLLTEQREAAPQTLESGPRR